MLLACIGVYGVVSYAVSRRVREIGIRMTLGADAREVKNLILRQAMRPVVTGALLGIAGCAAVSKILSALLFGVSAHDPVAFVVVPLILLSVALLASYIPARRATKVDPMVYNPYADRRNSLIQNRNVIQMFGLMRGVSGRAQA